MSWTEDCYGPVEGDRENVYRATWGHLAPEKGKKYPGKMLFCLSNYGDYTLIDAEWEGLDDSPWLFDAMMQFVGEKTEGRDGQVLRFEGHFRNYRFVGKVVRVV